MLPRALRTAVDRVRRRLGMAVAPAEGEAVREVRANDAEGNAAAGYGGNYITTSKYTLLSFVPQNLVEQFCRLANFYFLIISALQIIPGLSPTGRWTTALPLGLVLLATACKEAYEDIKRHAQDKQVNNCRTHVLRDGAWLSVKWHTLRVGDIVRVANKEFLPADLVLLSGHDPQGICYIETSQLDGETNLKIKQALEETLRYADDKALAGLRATVACELPNNRLHTFEGKITVDGATHALSPRQVLLRGACLRNTKFIHGIAIYTGHDTKLMMNQRAAPHKRSNLERMTNVVIAFLFVVEMLLAAVCAVGSSVWMRANADSMWYLGLDSSSLSTRGFLNFLTFVILFNNLIPISLYVSVEFVRLLQAYLINVDAEMVHRGVSALARTSDLNEELGQVHYVFSDKTGTLTQNVMQFRKCSVAGISYGEGTSEIMLQALANRGEATPAPAEASGGSSAIPQSQHVNFSDDRLLRNLHEGHPTADVIREFLTLLAVCHTVIPEVDDDGSVAYQAASPDESALVGAAKALGFDFYARTPKKVSVRIDGRSADYELLHTLEFNSTRKRQSVIVRSPEGRLILYCKGADTVVFQRLGAQQPYADATIRHLQQFASDGLRTLCLAVAVLDEAEYEEWARGYQEAATSIGDRERRLDEAAEAIERNLFLLGATAIEDKLQDGVPQTISTLLEADIKVWMLTGDKQETAINIGFACQLLTKEMQLMVLNEESEEGTRAALEKRLGEAPGAEDEGRGTALVVDSTTLDFALGEQLQGRLLALASGCKAVVCCRCTPLQKARVVQLVRESLGLITLAIGDGANDVSMIQSAHVGVGISGEEGLQAARSSDYAIAQFRFLRRLLFVHGRYAYRRLSLLILYSFYKSIALYLTQFWYTFANGFSGQSLYDRWTLTVYNVLFTFVPVIVFGMFDKDVLEDTVRAFPRLYALGQRREVFNYRAFFGWALNALWHSFVAFIVPFAAHQHSLTFACGWNDDMFSFGLAVYTSVVVVVSLKLYCETRCWTWITHTAYWVCLGLYLLWLVIYGSFWPAHLGLGENMWFLFFNMFRAPTFWFLIILCPVVALARDVCWKYYSRMYWPRPIHIAQELEWLAKHGGAGDNLETGSKAEDDLQGSSK
eukprot:m51a1_g5365 putative probable phospholipid-transporting atpase ia isoform x1 (1125) ;mRNA; f:511123-516212